MDVTTLTGGLLEPVVLWIKNNPQSAFIVFATAFLSLLFWLIGLTGKVLGMQKRQARLLSGAGGGSVEQMLQAHLSEMDALRDQLQRNDATAARLSDTVRFSMQRVGLVRYDAFPDTAGRQSFALAVLDQNDSGIVLTGIYSRADMRLYAKTLQNGNASTGLSDEEKKAVRGATMGTPYVEIQEAGARFTN